MVGGNDDLVLVAQHRSFHQLKVSRVTPAAGKPPGEVLCYALTNWLGAEF